MDDAELLKLYARDGSEPAFQTLVERYLGLVHSAALRQVRDQQMADDVAQVVFIILARKAGRLSARVNLPGWLYRTTRLASMRVVRTEMRRLHREQVAAEAESAAVQEETEYVWERIAPMLDEAMAQLSEKDRNAILFRFFLEKPLAEVGRAWQDGASRQETRCPGLGKAEGIFLPAWGHAAGSGGGQRHGSELSSSGTASVARLGFNHSSPQGFNCDHINTQHSERNYENNVLVEDKSVSRDCSGSLDGDVHPAYLVPAAGFVGYQFY